MKTLIATLIAAAFAIAPVQAQDKTTEAGKAEAIAKCEKMTGTTGKACVFDENGNVTTPGAAIAERTRDAVATVKEKTGAAVDRTKEMASGATRKTGDAADRAGDRTARAASDTAITTKVKAGLVAEPDLSGMQIGVDTKGGVVMLSGVVKSKTEADRAAKVAKSIDGVASVKNEIKVK